MHERQSISNRLNRRALCALPFGFAAAFLVGCSEGETGFSKGQYLNAEFWNDDYKVSDVIKLSEKLPVVQLSASTNDNSTKDDEKIRKKLLDFGIDEFTLWSADGHINLGITFELTKLGDEYRDDNDKVLSYLLAFNTQSGTFIHKESQDNTYWLDKDGSSLDKLRVKFPLDFTNLIGWNVLFIFDRGVLNNSESPQFFPVKFEVTQ